MALTNEDLLAISQLLDVKLKPIKDEQTRINLIIENEINHNINMLVENYVPVAKRYERASAQIEAIQSDVDLLKKVVAEHSEKLQKIS